MEDKQDDKLSRGEFGYLCGFVGFMLGVVLTTFIVATI